MWGLNCFVAEQFSRDDLIRFLYHSKSELRNGIGIRRRHVDDGDALPRCRRNVDMVAIDTSLSA